MPFTVQFKPKWSNIRQIKSAVSDATDEVIDECTEHAKDLAFFGKYSTGETKQSIANEVRRTKDGVRATIFTRSGHGGYVEAGTKKMKAEPFMWPAFIRTIPKIYEAIRERLS